MSLRDRLLKNSTIKNTSILSESTIFEKKQLIPTAVPMVNVAFSGSLDGGLGSGLTMLAGPSKHFKTAFSLLLANAFFSKHPDGTILFYDSEFGTPLSYFDTFDLPKDNIIHSGITNIEEFKQDIVQQLSVVEDGDKFMIIVDSVGNLASMKEVQDALDGKSVADMSRAKALKSVFRMVTPHLTLKNIPMVVVNHTYKEIGMFPKDIVGGGTGSYYSSDNIWIIGRQQDKGSDKELKGYNFIINIEKSRFVREKSRIPITVSFEGGIQKWSGMLELALEFGILTEEGRSVVFKGEKFNPKTIENDSAFWGRILAESDIAERIKKQYQLVTGKHQLTESVALNNDENVEMPKGVKLPKGSKK